MLRLPEWDKELLVINKGLRGITKSTKDKKNWQAKTKNNKNYLVKKNLEHQAPLK